MSIINLNVIGSNAIYQLSDNSQQFTIKEIYIKLMRHGFKFKDISDCNYICNGNKLELNEVYNVNKNTNIYMIIKDEDFKKNIITKFEELEIDGEPEELNTKLCEYFEDPKFIELLKIVKKNPEYLLLVNAYLSNGDIKEKVHFDDIDINDFNYDNEYKILEDKMKENINEWDELKVKKLLKEYNGNVNLTARYLLL